MPVISQWQKHLTQKIRLMDKKTSNIVVSAALLIGFFLPWINFFGMGGSAFDLVMEVFKHFGTIFEQTPDALLSLLLLLFPICGLIILINPSSSNKLAKQLPFIFIIIVIVYGIMQMGSDTKMLLSKDIFQVVGIGLWLTLISSTLLFFDKREK